MSQLDKDQQWERIKLYIEQKTDGDGIEYRFWLDLFRNYGKACAEEAKLDKADKLVSAAEDVVREFEKDPNRPSRAMMAALVRVAALLPRPAQRR